ncbi:hypothetical protein PORY_001150 [Pneumocystis oryctolagi]|uniref:Uncharacterized protein n=1 Tax=Pneumocystis oryctolagi TaxID=42067 RepID=A0ACB7CFC6_9ASCO|nr:hypothetical protein PORY_001150 [Pneumocystis oryctolagi]
MKAFVIVVFFFIKRVFSGISENVYKKSLLLNEIDEEELLALILKEELMNSQCKTKLEEYCKGLRNMNIEPEDLHPLLKNLCEQTKENEKCTTFKTKIIDKCAIFKRELLAIMKDLSTMNDECMESQNKCAILEGPCKDIRKYCNTLRLTCIKNQQDNLEKEYIFGILSGALTDEESCRRGINEICPMFMKESDRLMSFCLGGPDRCIELLQRKEQECSSLKSSVKEIIKNFNRSKVECSLQLEKCYVYGPNCDDDVQNDCKKLKEECKEIKYEPLGSAFNPIKQNATLMEKVEKIELFGNKIVESKAQDTDDLLILVSQHVLHNCQNNLEKCYEICRHIPQLRNLYNKTTKMMKENMREVCTDLRNRIIHKCKILKSELKYLSLYDSNNDKKEATLLGWNELLMELDEETCLNLKSKCFYSVKHCKGHIELTNSCLNLQLACLKIQFRRKFYKVFQEELKGNLYNLALKNSQNKCRSGLQDLCKRMINTQKEQRKNVFLIELCLMPENTCIMLENDLKRQVQELIKVLNEKRDFPEKEDCKELERRCEILGLDSDSVRSPCITLKQHCSRLKSLERLEKELLKENDLSLKDEISCQNGVKKLCKKWFRRGDDEFFFICINLDVTCQMIIKSMRSKCQILKENINKSGIIERIRSQDNIDSKGTLCDFWEPYCDRFMKICEELKGTIKSNEECKKLKNECKEYRERKDLETKALFQLRENLANEKMCNDILNKYCIIWRDTNNQLETLCRSSTGFSDENVKEALCKKLINQINEYCTGLLKLFKNMTKKIEEQGKKYDEIKKEAEQSIIETHLVFLVSNAVNNTFRHISNMSMISNTTNSTENLIEGVAHKVKIESEKEEINIKITENDVVAFEKISLAFDLYIELKNKCKLLQQDCKFRKECSTLESECARIDHVCNELKPLKVEKHVIETSTEIKTTEGNRCTLVCQTDNRKVCTSIHENASIQTSTITSTITLTSTRLCKPIKCTEENKTKKIDPNEGMRISGGSWESIENKRCIYLYFSIRPTFAQHLPDTENKTITKSFLKVMHLPPMIHRANIRKTALCEDAVNPMRRKRNHVTTTEAVGIEHRCSFSYICSMNHRCQSMEKKYWGCPGKYLEIFFPNKLLLSWYSPVKNEILKVKLFDDGLFILNLSYALFGYSFEHNKYSLELNCGSGLKKKWHLIKQHYGKETKILAAEGKKKDFDEYSRNYYHFVSRYLSKKNYSSKIRKVREADVKYSLKRKNFEINRFDYYSYMQDISGGKKEQEILHLFTLYVENQFSTLYRVIKVILDLKPGLDSLIQGVHETNKNIMHFCREREERRRVLEKSKTFIQESNCLFSSVEQKKNLKFQKSRLSLYDRNKSRDEKFCSNLDKLSLMENTQISNSSNTDNGNASEMKKDFNKNGIDNASQRRKEGLLWALSRPGSHTDPRVAQKLNWHKYWIVLAGGKLCEYQNWKQAIGLHNNPIDLRMASVRKVCSFDRRFCFEVITPKIRRIYQATSEEDVFSWISSISRAIESLLEGTSSASNLSLTKYESKGPESRFLEGEFDKNISSFDLNLNNENDKNIEKNAYKLLNIIRDIDPVYNTVCADCGSSSKAEWCSINIPSILCIECSGVHRSLGSHISKVRSLMLDTMSFTDNLVDLICQTGNKMTNSIYEATYDSEKNTGKISKPHPNSSREEKQKYIYAKYVDKVFVIYDSDPTKSLFVGISDKNIKSVIQALASGADPNAIDPETQSSALILSLSSTLQSPELNSDDCNQSHEMMFPIAEYLLQNGAKLPSRSFILQQEKLSLCAKIYLQNKYAKNRSNDRNDLEDANYMGMSDVSLSTTENSLNNMSFLL